MHAAYFVLEKLRFYDIVKNKIEKNTLETVFLRESAFR